MAEWDSPEWLKDALGSISTPSVPFPDSEGPTRVKTGDIRAARPMDGGSARLVLILNESASGWANTMLLANVIEAATNRDVRLDPEDTRLPFPVLVETDVVGPMFVVQFGPLLGRIDDEMIATLSQVKRGDDSYVLADRRGLPVLSRKEYRVRWKQQELETMHSLAGHCFAELMQKEEATTPVLADPALFEDLDHAEPADIVVRLLEVAKIRNLDVPPESLGSLEGLKSWLARLDPGAIAALEPIWRGVLRETRLISTGAESGAWEPARRAATGVLERHVAARTTAGERSIPIATRSEFWEEDVHEGIVKVRLKSGKLVQLSPVVLEAAA